MAEQVISQHITVPGVQSKLSMHLEKGSRTQGNRLTLVGLEGGYILKPPVKEYPEMPELEHLTMRMTGCFGIPTAECGLIPMEDGQLAFITKRMDRMAATKLHIEDKCQLTDKLTEQKYRGSMEQIGRTILRYCDNALLDALRFFEVALFSFLTGNSDMHLKNFSLLYQPGGAIALSPSYDLLPTQLLLPENTEESALTINGRKRRLDRTDFLRLAQSLRLNDKQVQNALSRFENNLIDAYDILDSGLKYQYKALIQDRAGRLEL